jgi:hypothetical protein
MDPKFSDSSRSGRNDGIPVLKFLLSLENRNEEEKC